MAYNNAIYNDTKEAIIKSNNNDFTINRWIKPEDSISIIADTNFIDSYIELFDLSAKILSVIPNNEVAHITVSRFINEFNLITSEIITQTITKSLLWNIDLYDKCLWIAMTLAIKLCPSIIKYLSVITPKECLIYKDNFSCNCIILSCIYCDALTELNKYYPDISDMILNTYCNNINGLDVLIYNSNIIYVIQHNILSWDDINNYTNNTTQMNVYHFCATIPNDIFIKYAIDNNKLYIEQLMKNDINDNVPLFVALMHNIPNIFSELIRSDIYMPDIFTLKNKMNDDLVSFFPITNVFNSIIKNNSKMVSNDIFIEYKLYNYINGNNIIEFIKCNLFNDTLMNHKIESCNYITVLQFLFMNDNIINEIIKYDNEDNNVFIAKLKQILRASNNIFVYILKHGGFNILHYFVSRNCLDMVHYTEKYDDKTIIDNIIDFINNNTDACDMYNNNIKDIIKDVFHKYNFSSINSLDFIISCISKYDLFIINLLQNNQSIQQYINKLIDYYDDNNKLNIIMKFIDKALIKTENLRNRHILLKNILICHDRYLHFILTNDLLDDKLLKQFSYNNIIIFNFNYTITDNTFRLLIKDKYLTPEIINNFDENYGSFLVNIPSVSKLNILFQERPDFNQELLFKKYNGGISSYFINELDYLTNNTDIIITLLNNPYLTKDIFDDIIDIKRTYALHRIFRFEHAGMCILNHKYISAKIFDIVFDDVSKRHNIIHYMIDYKYSTSSICNFLESSIINSELFNYRNNNNEYYIIYAYNAARYDIVEKIMSMKYFTLDILADKTNSNISLLDIMQQNPVLALINKYIELSNNNDFLLGKHANKTLLLRLIEKKANIHLLVNLINKTNINNILDSSVYIHTFLLKYSADDIIYLLSHLNDLDKLNLLFTLRNEYNQTPLMVLIRRKNTVVICVFTYMIQNNIFNKSHITDELAILITYVYPELIETFKNNGICEHDILNVKNTSKTPLYFTYIDKYNDNNILNTKFITRETLLIKNSNGEHLIDYIMKVNLDLFEYFLDMEMIGDDILYNILINVDKIDKKIISKIMVKNSDYLFSEKNMIMYINSCISKLSSNITIFINSKYCSQYVLNNLDITIITSLMNTFAGLTYILDNKLLSDANIQTNIQHLFDRINNPTYLKYLFKYIDNNVLINLKFKNNKTLLHKLASTPYMITHFINTNCHFITDEIIYATDDNKNNFLHVLALNYYISDIYSIMNHERFKTNLQQLITTQNNIQINVLMILADISDNFIVSIFNDIIDKSIYLTIASLCTADINNMSLFAKLVKNPNNNKIVKYILDKYGSDADFIKCIISKFNAGIIIGHDILEITTVYNPEILDIILCNPYITEHYSNLTKCFLLACRYQHNNIRKLLNTQKVDLFNCYDIATIHGDTEYDYFMCNYLQIACIYNSDSVKELVNSNININDALIEQNTDNPNKPFNAFILAIIYNNNSVAHLINSNFVNNEYILSTNTLLKQNCLHYAYNINIASLNILYKSPKFAMFHNDATEGNISMHFRHNDNNYYNENQISLDDPLLNKNDMHCTSGDINMCTICCSNIQCVIFAPCSHKTCVSCAIKINKCHLCRSNIAHKLYFN